jgi:hypothetical protein
MTPEERQTLRELYLDYMRYWFQRCAPNASAETLEPLVQQTVKTDLAHLDFALQRAGKTITLHDVSRETTKEVP